MIPAKEKFKYKFGLLAQLVEQLTFNQLVEGSNPSQPTIFKTSV